MRHSVRFLEAIETASAERDCIFVEVGPHPVLSIGVESILSACGRNGRAITTLRRQQDEYRNLLQALGALHVHGVPVKFSGLYSPHARVVPLPVYPWQHKRYWPEVVELVRAPVGAAKTGHPLLGLRLPMAGAQALYETTLRRGAVPYLGDYRIFDEVLMPGAVFVEMAYGAAMTRMGTDPLRLNTLALPAPLLLPDKGTIRVQSIVTPVTTGRLDVAVYGQPANAGPDDAWTHHAQASISTVPEHEKLQILDLPALRAVCSIKLDVGDVYAALARKGLRYGPAFHAMVELWAGEREALSRIALPSKTNAGSQAHTFHPVLLDAALQTLAATIGSIDSALYLPFEFQDITCIAPCNEYAWVHAQLLDPPDRNSPHLTARITIADDTGRVLVKLDAVRMRRTRSSDVHRAEEARAAAEQTFTLGDLD